MLIPKRELIGAITLDSVPYEKWEVVDSSPRWWDAKMAAWWWADGVLSSREIRDRVVQEFGSVSVDLIKYFRFLEKHGYVEFV